MNSFSPIIQTMELTRCFGKFVAVDRVSMEVSAGEIFGFLGANGAGKTTLIRMLCGLLKPTSGKGYVAGLDVSLKSETVKKKIGYMSQKFSLYEDLTVSENMTFYGGIYGLAPNQNAKRKVDLLRQLNLETLAGQKIRDLPPGFRQRLALGCAMIHDPPILFLDEPTSGVDPRARRSFWELIQQKARAGTTVLVTTHFMEEAEYCNRILIMDAGRAAAIDTPGILKERFRKRSIQDVFMEMIQKGPRA